MDLNYLCLRRQVSQVRADRAACDASRSAHEALAGFYQSLIDRARAGTRATALRTAAC
jgi:hypothetical protein